MEATLVSVTVCTFNGAGFLEKTLKSVLAQTHSNLEIVLVDDGSTDGTRNVADRFAQEDARIRTFYRANHGLPASRNFAFAQARGEWVAIIDQDDLCYPTRLERQLEVARNYPTAGLVFCNTHYIDESDDVIGEHMSGFSLPERFIPKGLAANLLLRQGCYIDSESCFISRKTIRTLGGLDETLRYACDYEYFIRAGFAVDFAYSDEILAAWRIHANQATKKDGRKFVETCEVYWRFIWNRGVTLRSRTSLIVNLCKSLALHFLSKIRA